MGIIGFVKAKLGYQRNVNITHINPNDIKKGTCKINGKRLICKNEDGSVDVCDIKKTKCKRLVHPNSK